MPDIESRQNLTEQEIKSRINDIVAKPEICGFEVYVITKSEPYLKKMRFVETGTDDLRHKVRNSIFTVLNNKYNSDEAEYVSVDRIADDQHKFYIIPTGGEYDPLSILRSTNIGTFSKNDISDATGIAFSIRRDNKQLWAYQHIWSIMMPNRSRKNWMARLVSKAEGDVFEELTDPVLAFAEKIDLLVIDDYIIASDYKLLQKSFGFQDYIRIRAGKTIEAILAKSIVANPEKLTEYVQRGHGKPKYAKKMMRVADSSVLKMPADRLWGKIHESSRWNGRIQEKDGQFVLETYVQVENLIDLLDERYTRSDITDQEYDTEVKRLAEPPETKE